MNKEKKVVRCDDLKTASFLAGSSSPPALDSRKRILIEMISREGSFLRKLVSVSRRRVSRVAFGYRFPYARKYFFACTRQTSWHFRNCVSEGDIAFSTEIANKREGYEMEGASGGASVRHKDAISRSTEGEI